MTPMQSQGNAALDEGKVGAVLDLLSSGELPECRATTYKSARHYLVHTLQMDCADADYWLDWFGVHP